MCKEFWLKDIFGICQISGRRHQELVKWAHWTETRIFRDCVRRDPFREVHSERNSIEDPLLAASSSRSICLPFYRWMQFRRARWREITSRSLVALWKIAGWMSLMEHLSGCVRVSVQVFKCLIQTDFTEVFSENLKTHSCLNNDREWCSLFISHLHWRFSSCTFTQYCPNSYRYQSAWLVTTTCVVQSSDLTEISHWNLTRRQNVLFIKGALSDLSTRWLEWSPK